MASTVSAETPEYNTRRRLRRSRHRRVVSCTGPKMEPSASSHLRGCVLYFFQFMAYGCVFPFMPLIWRSKGLSEHQVGLLGAINPVASFFWTPVACAFADRHNIQQQVVYVALFLLGVTRPSVLFASSFLAVSAVEISVSVSGSPVGSLIDSAVRHAFGGDGFGSQRLWGAIGFGIASLIAGFVCDLYGGSYNGVMAVFAGNIMVALVASTGVPIGQANRKSYGDGTGSGSSSSSASGEALELLDRSKKNHLPRLLSGAGDVHQGYDKEGSDLEATPATTTTTTTTTAATIGAAVADNHLDRYDDNDDGGETEAQTNDDDALLGSHPGDVHRDGNGTGTGEEGAEGAGEKAGVLMAIRTLLGTEESASFFMAVVLSGMGSGVIDTFLFIRLEELGGSHLLCGLARLIMCVAEVPFFYLSGPLIRRVGVRGVIALAQLAYLTRFVYYSTLREPWWVLPAEVLHGLTYAAMWAATTDYAHQIAPAHLRTTIQGAVSGLHWGLGFGLGAMLGGVLYASLGARRCFAVSAALPSMSLLLLALPSARRWCSSHGLGGRRSRAGLAAGDAPSRGRRHSGDEGRSYELVSKEPSRNDDQNNKTDRSSSDSFSDDNNLEEEQQEEGVPV